MSSLEVEHTNCGAANLLNKSVIGIFDAKDRVCLEGTPFWYVSTQCGTFAQTIFGAHLSDEKSVIYASIADTQVCCFRGAEITRESTLRQSHFSGYQGVKEELLWSTILSKLARFSNYFQSWPKSP